MIRGLQPSMTYQFHVVAQNPRGTSAPSEVLQVTTLIEVSILYLFLSFFDYYIYYLVCNILRDLLGQCSWTSTESRRSCNE